MDEAALVQLALSAQSCNQKSLAARLSVSPTQITKWKSGEHMSPEMEAKLRKLAGVGDYSPGFVLAAGSVEDAVRWQGLIGYLADCANASNETGYDAYLLLEETRELLADDTFDVLGKMGITIPSSFPDDLIIDLDADCEDAWEERDERLERNPYSATIRALFTAYGNLYGFYAAYIEELVDDDGLDLHGVGADNIEPCLLDLAISKIDVDPQFAPDALTYGRKIRKQYAGWLQSVKDKAYRAGAPLRAELMDLVHDSDDAVGQHAEAEALGFNSTRIHPDIYMNELLVGMRLVHQVLPAILSKLGIDDLEIDDADLSLGSRKD